MSLFPAEKITALIRLWLGLSGRLALGALGMKRTDLAPRAASVSSVSAWVANGARLLLAPEVVARQLVLCVALQLAFEFTSLVLRAVRRGAASRSPRGRRVLRLEAKRHNATSYAEWKSSHTKLAELRRTDGRGGARKIDASTLRQCQSMRRNPAPPHIVALRQ